MKPKRFPTDEPAGAGGRAGTGKARILLVDDHSVVRDALDSLISGEKDLSVCGGVADADAALKAIASLSPDLVVLDISLVGRDGIELVKEIRCRDERLPLLVLSMHDEATYAERAIRAGATGYVMKQSGSAELLEGIRKTLRGEIHVSGRIASGLLRKLSGVRMPREGQSVDQLTDRELQVLRLIGQGESVREIAGRLFVSPKTIESHRENVKRKLKLKNSNELLRYAIEHSRAAS